MTKFKLHERLAMTTSYELLPVNTNTQNPKNNGKTSVETTPISLQPTVPCCSLNSLPVVLLSTNDTISKSLQLATLELLP